MAAKTPTPERQRRAALKKQREIAKWEKEKSRPRRRTYLVYMVFLICLVYITDEIASQICAQMKTEIAGDLFVKFGDRSLSTLGALELISYPCIAVSLFYKTLSDRYGRRLFLVVNTFGMAIGMTLIFLSGNIPLYIVGYCVISFFVPHDMQVVYIMETAPAKHRAKIYSLVRSAATLGVMLIPLLRRVFMQDQSQWRRVFLVPAILGLAASFLALLLSRETDVFIDSRLKYLRMSEEELRAEKARKDVQNAQGGFFAALKFAMRHRQLRWLYILMAFHNLGFIITMNYQPMLSYGYAGNLVSSGAAKTLDDALNAVGSGGGAVTQALFLFAVGSAVFQFIVGFVSDKLGRKPAAAMMSALTLATLLLFTFGAKLGWAPWLVGFLTGACVGSFWSVGDVNVMMMSESAPTNLRSSVASSAYVIQAIGTVVGMAVLLPTLGALGNAAITSVVLCISAPGILAGLLLVLMKTHETKGTDLDTVTGCEWDREPGEQEPEIRN
ncbi:MAG: MFS transporter [Clostridia bacterium]|nr:MFS transporter [Clostridia bacterium]